MAFGWLLAPRKGAWRKVRGRDGERFAALRRHLHLAVCEDTVDAEGDAVRCRSVPH